MEVRARLTLEAAVRRSQGLDAPLLSVEGKIVEANAEGLALDVLVARNSSAFQAAEIRDTVKFVNTELLSLQQRELSAGRSVLFTVATIAAAAAVIAGIQQVAGGTEDMPDPGDTNLRAPFSIHPRRSITMIRVPFR